MNFQDVIRDVHDPANHALQTVGSSGQSTVFVGTPTLFAVVNTSAQNGQATVDVRNNVNALVTVYPRTDYIGLMSISGNVDIGTPTVFLGTPTLNAVVNIPTSQSILGNLTLSDSQNFIGLTTSVVGNTPTIFVGTPTLYAVVNTVASSGFATVDIRNTINANVSLSNSISNIGFATVNVANSVGILGNLTIDSGNISLKGNVTISDSKGFIGLTTTVIGNNSVQAFGQFYPTPQSIASGGLGPVLLDNFGRIQTVNVGNITIDSGNISLKGNITINSGTITAVTDITNPIAIKGNMTLSDSKGFIGLTSIQGNVNLNAGVNGIGFATVKIDTGTKYIGLATVDMGVNQAWADPKTYIGLTTSVIGNNPVLGAGVNGIGFATINQVNQPALVASSAFIGLVTVANTIPTTFSGNITLDSGSKTGIVGNVTISDSKSYIGLASVNVGAIAAGANYIGLMSVNVGGSLPALTAGVANIGFASVTPVASWPDPKTFIGLVTASNGLAWTDPKTYIGLTTVTIGNTPTVFVGTPTLFAVVNTGAAGVQNSIVTINPRVDYFGLVSVSGNVAVSSLPALVASSANIGSVSILGGGIGLNAGVNNIGFATTTNVASTLFIGLVTAWTRNAGTTKTLVSLPVAISTGSQATIAVPTNANTMYITNLLLNSDATVRMNILSGVTYLNGNASIGITINPGSGWAEAGSPDSPTYIGNPSGAIVIQKFDMTGISAKIAGKVVYFQE